MGHCDPNHDQLRLFVTHKLGLAMVNLRDISEMCAALSVSKTGHGLKFKRSRDSYHALKTYQSTNILNLKSLSVLVVKYDIK